MKLIVGYGWLTWAIKKLTFVTRDEFMAAIDDLKTAVKNAEARIDAVGPIVDGLRSTVGNLQQQFAAQPIQDSTLAQLAAELTEHVGSMDAILGLSVPVANTEPGPGPHTTDA